MKLTLTFICCLSIALFQLSAQTVCNAGFENPAPDTYPNDDGQIPKSNCWSDDHYSNSDPNKENFHSPDWYMFDDFYMDEQYLMEESLMGVYEPILGNNGDPASITFNEPLLRGAHGNTAWLGNAGFPFWQVRTNELWVSGSQISSSDSRFKTNIKLEVGALSKLMQLKPVTYDKLDINENTPEEKKAIINERGKNQHGLIAQEVLAVFPELVVQNEEGYYGVKYQELISVLIKAMQEQQTQIDSLKINLKD